MQENPTLFSYIVTDDVGFAPNPYFGVCTLAACKPQIRARAQEGDIVIGLGSKELGHPFVYAMLVEEVLGFDVYYHDERYQRKKPDLDSQDLTRIEGDNFYQPLPGEGYLQMRSVHSGWDGTEDLKKKVTDLSGKHVLTSRTYYYYGESGQPIPDEIAFLKVGRGHKSRFDYPEIMAVLSYLEALSPGVQGAPRDSQKELRRLSRLAAQARR